MATYSLDPVTGKLGEARAAHLLRRTTFGPVIARIKEFADYTCDEALAILLADKDKPNAPIDIATGETWVDPLTKPKADDSNSEDSTLFNYFKAWFIELMRTDGEPYDADDSKISMHIRERMVYFLHTHIPASYEVINSSEAIYYQNALYRHYALGNFKELFKKVCRDNAMLRYLDGDKNRKGQPNENFAREMLELYSIGKGLQIGPGNYTNFTEDDIKAATRVLTGYKYDDTFTNFDEDTNLPIGDLYTTLIANPGPVDVSSQHDAGIKKFSAAFGEKEIIPTEKVLEQVTKTATITELDEMIDMIFDEEETSKFICRKLYRFFVYWKITENDESDLGTESQIIEPLATIFKSNGYELQPVLDTLLRSQHFYDEDNPDEPDNNIGALIKSPLELIVGTLRFFNIKLPNPDPETGLEDLYNKTYIGGIFKWLEEQGLDFYKPFDVAGYDAYHQFPTYNRNWITAINLAYRYRFSDKLMGRSDDTDYGLKFDIVNWLKDSGYISNPYSVENIVETLTTYLFPISIDTDRKAFFEGVLGDTMEWAEEWAEYVSDPSDEGIKNSIRERLENLLEAIIQTPEFQLF